MITQEDTTQSGRVPDKIRIPKKYNRMMSAEKRKNEKLLCNALDHGTINVRYKLRRNIIDLHGAQNEKFGGAELFIGFHSRRLHIVSAMNMVKRTNSEVINLSILSYILRSAISDISTWDTQKNIVIPLSIYMIKNDDSRDIINTTIKNSGLSKTRFIFSIDESDIINASPNSMDYISRMHDDGISFILSSYGKVYGAINLLLSGRFLGVKLDQNDVFRNDADRQDVTPQLIHVLNKISEGNNLLKIVDGVENEYQINALRLGRVDGVQGSWISPLLTSAQVNSVFRPTLYNI